MIKKYYAIRIGRKSHVIVRTWEQCSKLVTGYPGAVFKGFKYREQAEAFLIDKPPKWVASKKPDRTAKGPVNQEGVQGIVFEPPTLTKDRYGYYKPRYYSKNGVRMAHYGRFYNPSVILDPNDTRIPWDTDEDAYELMHDLAKQHMQSI